MVRSLEDRVAAWAIGVFALVFMAQLVDGEITVLRRLYLSDVIHRDYFNIPSSKCSTIQRQNRCGYYGGFERSVVNKCRCMCPPSRGTIAPHMGTWKCTNNREMRRFVGCGFLFRMESSSSYISMLSRGRWKLFHAPVPTCRLDTNKTLHLGCNGRWLRVKGAAGALELTSLGYDQAARLFSYKVLVKRSKHLSGKLVKVGVTCSPFRGKPCAVVKILGKTKCNTRKLVQRPVPNDSTEEHGTHLIVATFPIKPTYLISQTPTSSAEQRKRQKSDLEDETISAVLTATAVFIGVIIVVLAIKLFYTPKTQRNKDETVTSPYCQCFTSPGHSQAESHRSPTDPHHHHQIENKQRGELRSETKQCLVTLRPRAEGPWLLREETRKTHCHRSREPSKDATRIVQAT